MGYTCDMEIEDIRTKFDKSKKIAICIPEDADKETVLASIILCKFIKEGKKEVTLLHSSLNKEFKDIYEKADVLVQSTAKPISYVVSIDYGKSNIESITYDRKDDENTLYFYITPTSGDFDFKNIDFSTEGNIYDLIITIGVSSFKDIGQIYEDNKDLFTKTDVISIVKGDEKLGDKTYSVNSDTSLIYGIRQFIGGQISKKLINDVLESIIEIEPVLEGDTRKHFFYELNELTENGVDFTESLKKKYYSKSYPNLDLQIKLVHNIQVDKENRIIWAKVNHEDVKFCGVNKDNLDMTGRIIFNISKDFDLAFAVYEIEKDTLEVLIESNSKKYSAEKVSGVFNGKGDERHARFSINNLNLKDFEKNVFTVLNDIYGLNIRGTIAEFRTGSINVAEDKEK